MTVRWGVETVEFGDPVELVARLERPCQACGRPVPAGERFVSLKGYGDGGPCFVGVCLKCHDGKGETAR